MLDVLAEKVDEAGNKVNNVNERLKETLEKVRALYVYMICCVSVNNYLFFILCIFL